MHTHVPQSEASVWPASPVTAELDRLRVALLRLQGASAAFLAQSDPLPPAVAASPPSPSPSLTDSGGRRDSGGCRAVLRLSDGPGGGAAGVGAWQAQEAEERRRLGAIEAEERRLLAAEEQLGRQVARHAAHWRAMESPVRPAPRCVPPFSLQFQS